MRLKKFWNFVLGEGRVGINRRVTRILFLISTATMILAGILIFTSLFVARNSAIDMGNDLGRESFENSSEILREQKCFELMKDAKSGADDVGYIISEMERIVSQFTREMNRILAEPENYSPRTILPPDKSNAGILIPQLMYPEGTDINSLRGDIAIAANISDFLIEVTEANKMIQSTYAASDSGYFIIVDRFSELKDAFFEPRVRPWYVAAKNRDKFIVTDVIKSEHGPGYWLMCAAPYYRNGKFAGVIGIDVSTEEIIKIMNRSNAYKSSFSFVINERGNVILSSAESSDPDELKNNPDSPFDLREDDDVTLAEAAKLMTLGETGVTEIQINGKDYYLAYSPIENRNWSFGVLISKAEVMAPVEKSRKIIDRLIESNILIFDRRFFFTMAAASLLALLLLPLVSYIGKKLSNHFVKPIIELADGVREISSGNLDKKLEIHTDDEIEHLAVCFNAMTDELKVYMANLAKETAENERISTELNVATNIQQSMLPHDFPSRADFEIYATMNAAKEVGGDFYDFYLLDENHLVITIADVSGKGVPAALFMAISKTILQNFALSMKNPDDFSAVMTLANQQLCKNNDEMLFVTVFMGMLDLQTGEFVYVNGGHNAPLVCRENKFEYLDVGKSCMLGIDEDVPFPQKKIKLVVGDMIFLYTDGVTEAMNVAGELFGENYLSEVLNGEDKSESLEILLENVRKAIKIHAGDAEQSDDITMLALKWNGGDKIDC